MPFPFPAFPAFPVASVLFSCVLLQEVRSLKCDDCGKILRTEQEAQAHAARTQYPCLGRGIYRVSRIRQLSAAAAQLPLRPLILAIGC